MAATHSWSGVARELTIGHGYELADLALLEKSLLHVRQKYVNRDRLDWEEMYAGSLRRTEREVNEVMFTREPHGRRLQVSVGPFSTTLLVQPITGYEAYCAELRQVATVLQAHLSDEVELPYIEYAMINGALATLDPHSLLLPPEAAREMDVDNQGEFGGLGIEIVMQDGKLIVKAPMDDTPAERAGLRADDHIVRIEDESTINMDFSDAVRKLRGEIGTPVNILVRRKHASEPIPFTIIRDRIALNEVESALLEGDIGYIRAGTFNAKVSQQLDASLTRLNREAGGSLRGLVLDLRDNPGGYLTQAVEVANKFLDDGIIVSTVEGGTGRREEQHASGLGTEDDYPIAVLLTGSSASASEIVAGALRNQERAIIIGEHSFGKGSVQHLFTNRDESKLKLTVAKYLTPGDHSIQSVGIPPDILLEPAIIEPASEGETEPRASLYWRQWLDREADLARHLQNAEQGTDEAIYHLRYLRDAEKVRDPRRDWEVDFAREVLIAAGGMHRRASMLRSAAAVVQARSDAEEARIATAFGRIGIDWNPLDDESPPPPALKLALELPGGGNLVAGEPTALTLGLTNTGDHPISRVSAVTFSENPWLDHREFYFDPVAPGATVTASQQVRLADGFGNALSAVDVELRDAQGAAFTRESLSLRIEGRALPQFSYSVALIDDGSGSTKGDGDGQPDLGERVDLAVTVTNRGEGPSGEGFVRVKNRSQRALDLAVGAFALGAPDCEGDDCTGELAPGESVTGRVGFELRDLPDGERCWRIDLQVGDNRRFDYASVQRGGFYDYFQLEEELSLCPGQTLDGTERRPPEISVTRAPDLESAAPDLVISGMVTDDEEIRDVMIFHDDDKIFFRGGQPGLTALPFSIDPSARPGANLLVVLARDSRGLTTTHSLSTWHRAADAELGALIP